MKRTLAIFAAAALALTLAACGADMTGTGDYAARPSETVTSTDTMYNGETSGDRNGTGVYGGASTYGGYNAGVNDGLGTGAVAGAIHRAGGNSADNVYTSRNNGGYLSWDGSAGSVANANGTASADSGRYQLMLENGRVRDTDGYLLDGENAHYHTW